ncbi:MAG: hypothetical protein ACO36E_01205, partial [Synechocystis sp.]
MRYDPHPHRFIPPNTSHYWLENAHILPYLVADPSSELVATTSEGLALAHLKIKNGQLTQIIP